MPPNDVRSSVHMVTAGTVDGVRAPGYDLQSGTAVSFLPITGTAVDAGDPPFIAPDPSIDQTSNCVAGNDPQNYPTVTHTVWYQVVPTHNASQTTFQERTVVTMDAVNTTFNAAIVIFKGMPPVWNPGDPAPTNVVACSEWVSGVAAPYVSFIATPGQQYFALVGSLAQTNGQLSLNIRAADVQAPALTVSADSLLPDPNTLTQFAISASDHPLASVTTTVTYPGSKNGAPKAMTYVGLCPATGDPGRGRFCSTGGTGHPDMTGLIVHWPTYTGDGAVRVVATDAAGNSSPVVYTLRVRDRVPPKVLSGRAGRFGSAGARIVGSCNEPGRLYATVTDARDHSHKGHRHLKRVHPGRYGAIKRFKHVGHGFFTVRITCEDLAKNRSSIYTFLFNP
jgi:hypothetical protein